MRGDVAAAEGVEEEPVILGRVALHIGAAVGDRHGCLVGGVELKVRLAQFVDLLVQLDRLEHRVGIGLGEEAVYARAAEADDERALWLGLEKRRRIDRAGVFEDEVERVGHVHDGLVELAAARAGAQFDAGAFTLDREVVVERVEALDVVALRGGLEHRGGRRGGGSGRRGKHRRAEQGKEGGEQAGFHGEGGRGDGMRRRRMSAVRLIAATPSQPYIRCDTRKLGMSLKTVSMTPAMLPTVLTP